MLHYSHDLLQLSVLDMVELPDLLLEARLLLRHRALELEPSAALYGEFERLNGRDGR